MNANAVLAIVVLISFLIIIIPTGIAIWRKKKWRRTFATKREFEFIEFEGNHKSVH